MDDKLFEFDIDAQLEEAEARAAKKVDEQPLECLPDDSECESCKI